MAGVSEIELPVAPAADRDEAAPAADHVVVALGTWTVMLGAIRLACEIIEYAGTCRESMASGLIASRGWAWFLGANPPTYVVLGAWPLILGLALRRTGWRDLARAGALTFLVLSVGGLLTAVADWSHRSVHSIAIGSFRVPRSGWDHPSSVAMTMATAGAVQLLLELATAAWCLALAARRDGEDRPVDRPVAAKRSRSSRLALYASLAFLVLTVRLPAWSAYLELINQSQWVREFILRDDLARMRATRHGPPHESGWAAQAHTLLYEAKSACLEEDYTAASDHYAHLVALLNTIPPSTMNAADRRLAAEALNNWAWLLATCPETGLRDHAGAVKYARRALELDPNQFYIWNTLGVAYYRLGDWDAALSALYRSMELHDEGDSSDWYFLAMIHQKLGHAERAREWYDKAVRFAHRYDPDDEELYRFEIEAAEALGLPRPDRPPPSPHRLGPNPLGPGPFPGRRARMGPRVGGRDQPPGDVGGPGGRALRRRSVL